MTERALAGIIEYPDFEKVELRVAEIEEVEEIDGADKLYKLTIGVGDLGQRVICAGIKQFYSKDDLKGKKIIIVANLVPRKMCGVESQGMLLAASNKDHSSVVLVSVDDGAEPGMLVG